MQDEYRTVAHAGVHETEVNRSRFLCALAPAATEQEAQAFIASVRKEHADATHNCWAYVIGADASAQKASDDGEPGGTAGVPMLQMLLRRDMRYVVAVVTRYYGGVKLGAGGLIRAYGGAVGEALDTLGTLTRRRFRLATVTVDHQRGRQGPERPALDGPRGTRRPLRRGGHHRDRPAGRRRGRLPCLARGRDGGDGGVRAGRGGLRGRVRRRRAARGVRRVVHDAGRPTRRLVTR